LGFKTKVVTSYNNAQTSSNADPNMIKIESKANNNVCPKAYCWLRRPIVLWNFYQILFYFRTYLAIVVVYNFDTKCIL
jgi:hypothetical protein